MAGTVPDVRKLTDAVITMLTTATGRPFGDIDAPGNTTHTAGPADHPYGLVQRIAGGAVTGSVGAPWGMATVVYQVTCVGRRRDQADWLLDRVDTAMLDMGTAGYTTALAVTGLHVVSRVPDMDGGTDEEGDIANAVRRYAITVHP